MSLSNPCMASLRLASSYVKQSQVDVETIGAIGAAVQAAKQVPVPALGKGVSAIGKDRLYEKAEGRDTISKLSRCLVAKLKHR